MMIGNGHCPTCMTGLSAHIYWPYCSKVCMDIQTPNPDKCIMCGAKDKGPVGTWPYCSADCRQKAMWPNTQNVKTTLEGQPTVTLPQVHSGGTFQLLYKVCPCGIGFYTNPNATYDLDGYCSVACKKRFEPKLEQDPSVVSESFKKEIDVREKERSEFIKLFKEIYKQTDIFHVKKLIEERFFR